MNDFRERLQQAADFAGCGQSQADIARSLGLNRQTINLWFHGGEPNADMLMHIARSWGVDAEWLKSGNGHLRPGSFAELPQDEKDLLLDYRKASPKMREAIRSTARALRKAVVTIAAAIPPLMVPKDVDAALLHKQVCDAVVILIAGIRNFLRKLAPLALFALPACSTVEYVKVVYVETPAAEITKACPRLIGISGGCVVHKGDIAYIYAPPPRDVRDQFALYVLGHEFYCHAWLKASHTDEMGVRRDPDKDCNLQAVDPGRLIQIKR